MEDSVKQFIEDAKNHLADHDGELVYWGDVIARSAVAKGDQATRQSHEIATADKAGLAMTSHSDQLASLRTNTIGDCHLCPLGDTRIKLVFGVGNPDARVMFVGEGPGFAEDRQGEPFVGKAGQLLDKIMSAIGLDRTSVYIANIVKCHPMTDPSNPELRGNDRPPTPPEMEKCMPFLKRQIEIIRPAVIVALGSTAAKALLGETRGITALRGKLFSLNLDDGSEPIPVLPTFHPAALLRDESLKKPVWEDMKLLRSKFLS